MNASEPSIETLLEAAVRATRRADALMSLRGHEELRALEQVGYAITDLERVRRMLRAELEGRHGDHEGD